MKKRILTTTMALAMAFTTAMSGMGTLTVHAYTDDGAYHGNGREDGGGGSASLDDGSSSSSSDSGSSSSDSGSSNNGNSNYDDGAYHGNGREDGGGGNASLSDGGSSSASTASYTAPKAAGSTAGVTGKETFRALAKAGAGTYKVTHKGIEIATFTLMDSEKNTVSCSKVALKQREDGKWAVNYEVADATGLTVGAPLDRTYMFSTLGVSYITINDTVIIDIEAEAAAAK